MTEAFEMEVWSFKKNSERRICRRREISMFGKTMIVAALAASIAGAPAHAETPGVSESEVKIGATFPFSGLASPSEDAARMI